MSDGHGPANLVLQDAVERIAVGNRYGDIPRGLFLVRGENVVLLGEIVSASSCCRTAGCVVKGAASAVRGWRERRAGVLGQSEASRYC
jgi:hypothetical protein